LDKKPLVLIVDDHDLVRKALSREFRGEYEVLTASSREEAEAILDDNRDIRLVISDCRMETARSGIELLEGLHRKRRSLGRILVSGTTDRDEAEKLIAAGVLHAFFPKPWRRQELMEAASRFSNA
jgi:two-component system response regulator HupR/HoxA